MTRRRLGATVPLEERARLYELRIRELTRQSESLAAAAEAIAGHRGPAADPHYLADVHELLAGVARLEAIAHRPFRRPRPTLERPTPGLRQLRTNL